MPARTRFIPWALAFAQIIAVVLAPAAAQATDKPFNVLCTTFPLYQIARNVTQNRASLNLELMLPAQLGCPHDYALTPQDMHKLSRADVLIINGLGLEEFLGAPVRKANPRIQILDSSAGIKDILRYSHAEGHDHEGHADGHAGLNPHLFASPRMAARLTLTIAEGLGRIDPAGADLYARNAQAYAARLNALAEEMRSLGRTLANTRIVTQHGAFDYLARDMGLQVVGVVSAHAGQPPSAAQTLALVQTIRRLKAGAVFTEPQYPARIAQTIAREAGIPAAVLDPVAGGPARAGLDYYEQAMRRNMATLKVTLGTR
ncbi:MAG TPA: metal ABC transporter substrate-binding protein [Deltaproteobacteria bacterium]|nr:metal ABC transporter substrate-binding protein [Deltaproteobacteria bacterium]